MQDDVNLPELPTPAPGTVGASSHCFSLLSRLAWQSAGVYLFFLVPTILLLLYISASDATFSRNISAAWQAGFWHLPGLTSTVSRIALDAIQAFVVIVLGWFFYQGFRSLNQQKTLSRVQEQQFLKGLGLWLVGVSLILWAVIPFHSSDLYGYLNRGFQQSVFHTNPYLTPIVEITGWSQSPLFHPHWIYNPCPYGFFFAQLAKGLTFWSGGSFCLAFLLFKLLNVLLVFGSAVLIYQIAKAEGLKRPWLSTYLFAANPLVLLHALGNGHNDILMAFLLLGAIRCLQRQPSRVWALPLLTLSILTKYASLLALPFILIDFIKKRDWWPVLGGTLLSVALVIALGLPYMDPTQPWPWNALLDNAGKPQHSLIAMLGGSLYYTLKPFTKLMATVSLPAPAHLRDAFLALLKPIFWAIFVLVYAMSCLSFWREKGADKLASRIIARTAQVLTIMVALVSAKFHPWYPVMFLPVVLLQEEDSFWRRFALTLSIFQLLGFTVFQNLPVFSVLLLTLLPLYWTYKRQDLFSTPAA